MRRYLALFAIFGLAGPAWLQLRVTPPWNNTQAITARPITTDRTSYGGLELLEAWELTSPNSGFGGVSTMAVTGDRRFVMLSDLGHMIRFDLGRGGQTANVRIAALAAVQAGRGARPDMEAMTREPVTGQSWIAFEGENRIVRMTPDFQRIERQVWPREMRNWGGNSGPEAMTRLADGRFLLLAEGARTRSMGTAATLYMGDPTAHRTVKHIRFGYRAWGMGAPTEAATLPDGRVLLLHRQIDLQRRFISTLAIGDPRRIRQYQTWTTTPLAGISGPEIEENYEAMAIAPHPRGISIWLASDGNFNPWQRNLLIHLLLPTQGIPPR